MHLRDRLADAEAAEREAVERERAKLVGVAHSQLDVAARPARCRRPPARLAARRGSAPPSAWSGRPPLRPLSRGAPPGGQTSSCIAMSAPSSPCTRIASSGVSRCFDAVEVRAKHEAVLGERAALGQRERLKAAGVGDDGVRPARERVQAAEAPQRSRRRGAATGGRCSRARSARRSPRLRRESASSRCPACRPA